MEGVKTVFRPTWKWCLHYSSMITFTLKRRNAGHIHPNTDCHTQTTCKYVNMHYYLSAIPSSRFLYLRGWSDWPEASWKHCSPQCTIHFLKAVNSVQRARNHDFISTWSGPSSSAITLVSMSSAALVAPADNTLINHHSEVCFDAIHMSWVQNLDLVYRFKIFLQ